MSIFAAANSVESRAVALLLGLERGQEPDKWRCPVHEGTSLHSYPGPGAGFFCWGGCGGFTNSDVAAAAWGVEPIEAARQLAAHFGVSPADAPPVRSVPVGRAVPQVDQPDPARAERILVALRELRDDGCVPAPPVSVYRAVLAGGDAVIVGGAAERARLERALADSFLPAELASAGLWKRGSFAFPAPPFLVLPRYTDGTTLSGLQFRVPR